MKVKTSVTLTDSIIADMDKVCGGAGHRSAFVEEAIRMKLVEIARRQRELKDLDILNENAEALNHEADDVLEWQVSV